MNLVRLVSMSRDPTPCGDPMSARDPFTGNVVDESDDPELEDLTDDCDRQWMQRLADVLDAPGETTADACQLTTCVPGVSTSAEDL